MNGDIQTAGKVLAGLREAYRNLPRHARADVKRVLLSLVPAHAEEIGAQEATECAVATDLRQIAVRAGSRSVRADTPGRRGSYEDFQTRQDV